MKLKESNKIEFNLDEPISLSLSGEKLFNAVLEKELENFIGAGKHERNDERKDFNGYKELKQPSIKVS
jgi:transposase-like protein